MHEGLSSISPLWLLLVYLVPVLLLIAGAYLLLWYYLRETRKRQVPAAASPNDHVVVMPLRLQACERMVLLLERIHPANLMLRISQPELTAKQYQTLLVRTIREEFDYNLSQQLYVSITTWEMIRNAKEDTIAMINQAASALPEEAMAPQLSKMLVDASMERGKLPVESALEELKRDIQRLF